MELKSKVAVITGAASGIGAAAARLFIAKGARVVLTDLQETEGQRLATELGTNARFIQHDVRKQDQWETVMRFAEDAFGPVNVLCNNAGIIVYNNACHLSSEEEYRRVIDVNQVGVFLGMRSVVPSMTRAGGGSIVNTSSALGLVGAPGSIAYVASKFAVTGMTMAAALDFGSMGIRVNSIHPGLIETPISHDAPQEVLDAVHTSAKATPLGRAGRPEEMAELMAFLASDASSYCTGSNFAADAGWNAS